MSALIPPDIIESLPLLRELTPSQLAAAHAVLCPLNLPAGHELIGQGAADGTVYLVVQGSLKVCVSDGDDGETILALRGRGEVLGEMSALDAQKRSARVVTLEPCLLLSVSRADFWRVLWEMPPVAYTLTCLLSQRLRVLSAQFHGMATLDVPGRLARQIVLLADEWGETLAPSPAVEEIEIPFHLTQKEWASLIGATREQVNKLLRSWAKRGWIQSSGGRLIVCQRDALEEFYRAR